MWPTIVASEDAGDGRLPDAGDRRQRHHRCVDEYVTPAGRVVDATAVTWTSTRSGGPGGQHANTSDTAVTVTLDVDASGLPAAVRRRLRDAFGAVITARAADTRSQWRNRRIAWDRIAVRVDAAARPPRPRRPTRPGLGAVAARLDDKRRRADVKRSRRRPGPDDG
jgi:ribosome-associated protein